MMDDDDDTKGKDLAASESERSPLLAGSRPESDQTDQRIHVKIFKRRWYIVAATMLVEIVQINNWNTFGPIAKTAKYVFGWSNATIDLLANFGPIAFVLSAFPCMMIEQRFGLRICMLFASLLLSIASIVRIFAIADKENADVYLYIGQLLNGIPGPIVMFIVSRVAAVWFPPDERSTAVGILCVGWQMGNAVGFLISPIFVSSPDGSHGLAYFDQQVLNLLIFDAALAVLSFLVITAYYPNRPLLPPSFTASVDRMHFSRGVARLFTSGSFWCILLAIMISMGPSSTWMAVMVQSFAFIPITQEQLSILGLLMMLANAIACVCVAFCFDKFRSFDKLLCLCCLSIATVCFLVMSLLSSQTIPYSIVLLFASVIIGSGTLQGTTPIILEWCVEKEFTRNEPISETTISGILQLGNNVSSLVFLFVAQMLSCSSMLCHTWLNYYLFISSLIIFLMYIFYTPESRRHRIDSEETAET